jgi:hypothetical protein
MHFWFNWRTVNSMYYHMHTQYRVCQHSTLAYKVIWCMIYVAGLQQQYLTHYILGVAVFWIHQQFTGKLISCPHFMLILWDWFKACLPHEYENQFLKQKKCHMIWEVQRMRNDSHMFPVQEFKGSRRIVLPGRPVPGEPSLRMFMLPIFH